MVVELRKGKERRNALPCRRRGRKRGGVTDNVCELRSSDCGACGDVGSEFRVLERLMVDVVEQVGGAGFDVDRGIGGDADVGLQLGVGGDLRCNDRRRRERSVRDSCGDDGCDTLRIGGTGTRNDGLRAVQCGIASVGETVEGDIEVCSRRGLDGDDGIRRQTVGHVIVVTPRCQSGQLDRSVGLLIPGDTASDRAIGITNR